MRIHQRGATGGSRKVNEGKDGLDPGRRNNMNKDLEVREDMAHIERTERNSG